MDDNKGMVSSNLVGEEAEQEVANNLQESGQIWSNLQDITGQGLAYHKELWRMIAWKALNGQLEMVCLTRERVVLTDNMGVCSIIEYLGPNVPVTALGVTTSLDGDQQHQLKVL